MASAPALIDRHGRTISYLRLSVTDRCDLRCRYCMAERMTFLPRDRLLSLEEIAIIAERFIARGVTKIRQIGRAHVCTPVTNAHLVCRLLLETKKHITTYNAL